jgi:hypothetical protein
MRFPVTYNTNVFITVMFSRSSNLNFDFVFLKMRYFKFFEKIYCVHVTTIQNICKYQVGLQWDWFLWSILLRRVTCIDEANSSVKSFYNSDEVSRVMPGKKDYVSIKVSGVKIHEQKLLLLCNLKEFPLILKIHIQESK